MEILGGLVTLTNLLLAAVIGVRLFRLARRRGGSVERGLAVYFLFHAFLSGALSCGLYVGWADPEMALPTSVEIPLHATFQVCASIGVAGAYLFTWQTFRPGSEVAKGLVTIALAVMAASLVAVGLTDGFAVRVLNGPAYWVHLATKLAFLPWIAVESFRYSSLQSKRLALGLADPLVANRFWLWGWWSTAMLLLGLSDPIARLWYVQRTGSTTQWVPELGLPIVNTTIFFTSVLGLVAATALFLTFFPTARYRAWIEGRAARAAAQAG
ncbi:MAG: hypothetical protein ACQGVK_25245 [Myxococcota bacterium]